MLWIFVVFFTFYKNKKKNKIYGIIYQYMIYLLSTYGINESIWFIVVRKITKLIVNDLSKYANYNTDQKEQIEYSLAIIIYELIKFIFLLLSLYFLGFFKEGLVVLISMIISKPFIGGYHEDSQIKCFFATFLIVFSLILLDRNMELNIMAILILNLFSIFCVYHKAPIINDKMPLTKEKLIKRNRIIGLISVSLLGLISIVICNSTKYGELICLTNVVQTMLMFNKRK